MQTAPKERHNHLVPALWPTSVGHWCLRGGGSMKCPICSKPTKVLETRPTMNDMRRYRMRICANSHTTHTIEMYSHERPPDTIRWGKHNEERKKHA